MDFTRVSATVAIVSTGLIAGFFYAWVCSTMWGLDAIGPDVAIKAMNGMNGSVRNGVFFPAFFLTPLFLLVAAIASFKNRFATPAVLFFVASGAYFFGAFLPTALVNVPMNEALAVVKIPDDLDEARVVWDTYSTRWQWWNTARTLASVVALISSVVAALKMPTKV